MCGQAGRRKHGAHVTIFCLGKRMHIAMLYLVKLYMRLYTLSYREYQTIIMTDRIRLARLNYEGICQSPLNEKALAYLDVLIISVTI